MNSILTPIRDAYHNVHNNIDANMPKVAKAFSRTKRSVALFPLTRNKGRLDHTDAGIRGQTPSQASLARISFFGRFRSRWIHTRRSRSGQRGIRAEYGPTRRTSARKLLSTGARALQRRDVPRRVEEVTRGIEGMQTQNVATARLRRWKNSLRRALSSLARRTSRLQTESGDSYREPTILDIGVNETTELPPLLPPLIGLGSGLGPLPFVLYGSADTPSSLQPIPAGPVALAAEPDEDALSIRVYRPSEPPFTPLSSESSSPLEAEPAVESPQDESEHEEVYAPDGKLMLEHLSVDTRTRAASTSTSIRSELNLYHYGQTSGLVLLPIELLFQVLEEVYVGEHPDMPTHQRLIGVRSVCRLLRIAALDIIFRSLIIAPWTDLPLFDDALSELNIPISNTSDLARSIKQNYGLYLWLNKGTERRQTIDTLGYCLDNYSLPDDMLIGLFESSLSRCSRALVVKGPRDSGSAGHWDPALSLDIRFPRLNLTATNPWSQLSYLSLDCPLSDADAHAVLAIGRNSLESVALTLECPDPVLQGFEDITDPITTMERLTSLTVHTWFDLKPLFARLDLPLLKNFTLGAHCRSILFSPAPEDRKSFLDADLAVPWASLESLSLHSVFVFTPCSLLSILSKCDRLRRFEWNGGDEEYTLSGQHTISPLLLASLQELSIDSDWSGCRSIFTLFTRAQNLQRLSLSHLDLEIIRNQPMCSRLRDVTIKESLTPDSLFDVLRAVQGPIVRGSFATQADSSMSSDRCLRLRNLKYLTVRSTMRPVPLSGVILAEQLKDLTIISHNTVPPPNINMDTFFPESSLSRIPIVKNLRHTTDISYQYL